MLLNEDRQITFSGRKTKLKESGFKFVKPVPRCLL